MSMSGNNRFKNKIPHKGDIIIIPFPFSDLSEAKIRPAVVISNRPVDNEITVAFISSKNNSSKSKNNLFDISIKKNDENSLNSDSFIKCNKIATLYKEIILGQIGIVDADTMKKVDVKLRKYLDL